MLQFPLVLVVFLASCLCKLFLYQLTLTGHIFMLSAERADCPQSLTSVRAWSKGNKRRASCQLLNNTLCVNWSLGKYNNIIWWNNNNITQAHTLDCLLPLQVWNIYMNMKPVLHVWQWTSGTKNNPDAVIKNVLCSLLPPISFLAHRK